MIRDFGPTPPETPEWAAQALIRLNKLGVYTAADEKRDALARKLLRLSDMDDIDCPQVGRGKRGDIVMKWVRGPSGLIIVVTSGFAFSASWWVDGQEPEDRLFYTDHLNAFRRLLGGLYPRQSCATEREILELLTVKR